MPPPQSKNVFKILNPNRVWIPIMFGLGIVMFMFYNDPDLTPVKLKLIFDADVLPVVLALVVLAVRDAGYIYRIRVLTDKKLSWMGSVYVIILWEFSSAVTPSIVGGTAVAVFILLKEGINLGKSLSYVMLTAILDNLYFVLIGCLVLFLTAGRIFPEIENTVVNMEMSLQISFYLSYFLILTYTLLMSWALFLHPRGFKWIMLKITKVRPLRRWRFSAYEHGNEIMWASRELRGKGPRYWGAVTISTLFIWSARYILLNCLVESFVDVGVRDHLTIFGRQVIMWIGMLISPTPGSSGTAEFFFTHFFKDYLGDYTFVSSIFWRALTYYPYLILGAIFLPRWIKRVFFTKKKMEIS